MKKIFTSLALLSLLLSCFVFLPKSTHALTLDDSSNLLEWPGAQTYEPTVLFQRSNLTLSVTPNDYNQQTGKWNYNISWVRLSGRDGSVYLNGYTIAATAKDSGSAETGYYLNPNTSYRLIFYQFSGRKGAQIANRTFKTLDSPVAGQNDVLDNQGNQNQDQDVEDQHTADNQNNSICSKDIQAPATVIAGQPFSAVVTLKNTGTTIWTKADSFKLGSQRPQDNQNWGFGRVELTQSVNPGEEASFSFYPNARLSPGVQTFAWQMVKEHVAWFGAVCSKDITVTPASSTSVFVTPTALTFSAAAGAANPVPQLISINHSTTSTVSFSATTTTASGGNWLSISNDTSHGTINVSANISGLAAGTYNGAVKVSFSSTTTTPQTVPVTLTVTPANSLPTFGVSPTSLQFSGGAPQSKTLTISNIGSSSLAAGFKVTATTGAGGNWLSASPSSATTTATITVSISSTIAASLAPGSYPGAIAIASSLSTTAAPVMVGVTLTIASVLPPPGPSSQLIFASPTAAAAPGGSATLVINMSLLSGVSINTLSFSVKAQANGGAPSVAGSIIFTKDSGFVSPGLQDGGVAGSLGLAWLSTFSPVSGNKTLGTITIPIPSSAVAGQTYTVSISGPSAALDSSSVSLSPGPSVTITVGN